MSPMRTLRLALVALLLALPPAGAAVEEYELDPAHSAVTFQIRHFFSKVPGQFQKFTGSFAYDPADLATAKVKAEIDAASISTNQADRDKHLRSGDFFDVEKHPTIAFESTASRPTGKDSAVVTGNLTLHGVTRPVELQVSRLGALTDPWGNWRVGFEARATLDRKAFGITWNKLLDTGSAVLGDEVEVTINVEAVRRKEAAPGAAAGAAAPAAKTK